MNRFGFFILLLASGGALYAQDSGQADSLFRRGMQALERGDTVAYARNISAAAELMPAGDLNRPFFQYHAARGHALRGDAPGAARLLGTMLDEDIEGLMAWFSEIDPAFDRIRTAPSHLAVIHRMDTLRLRSTPLGNEVALVTGAGGNVLAVRGTDGVFLVDAGYAPGGAALRREAERSSRVNWIVLTHHHEDHAGGVAVFDEDTRVLAHPAAVSELGKPQAFIPGVEVPSHSFASRLTPVTARQAIALAPGDSAIVIPIPAHTAGDLVVWFPGRKVLATGDNYLPGANPFLELGGIEDIQGYMVAMGQLLGTLPPGTLVVPGHGKVRSLEDLLAIFRKTRDGIEFVRVRKAAGKTVDEVRAEAAAEGLPGGWVGRVYRRVGN